MIGVRTAEGSTLLFNNSLVRQLACETGFVIECFCDIVDCPDCPPWWCANPLSNDFMGGVLYSVDTDTVTNSLSSEGTICDTFYTPQNSEREITFDGMFFAKNSAALAFGVEWFQEQLQKLNSCTTNELYFLKACPCDDQDYEDLIGFLPDVKLKAGITLGDYAETCCPSDCDHVAVEFKFTLSAPNSDVFFDATQCMNDVMPPEVVCRDFASECLPCDNVETQATEVQYNRKPYLVKVTRNGWCPVGWDIDPMNFPPADGYFDIIETTESAAQPCFIRLVQTVAGGPVTWEPVRWSYTPGDPLPCDCVLEIAEICAPDYPDSTCTAVASSKTRVEVTLNTDSSTSFNGWDGTGEFPPLYADLVLTNNCGCTSVSLDDNEITLNSNGTWNPVNWTLNTSDYFPPDNLTVQTTSFTYTVVEDIPISNLVGGCEQPTKPVLTPITDLECYCEPWEYLELCCSVDWVCGGDWVPVIKITGGAQTAYNARLRVWPKRAGEPNYCDDKELYRCRDLAASIWIPKIPANQQLIWDGRTGDRTYVYGTGLETNGGTWFEPLSYSNMVGAGGAAVQFQVQTTSSYVPSDIKIEVVFYRRTNVLIPA